MTLKRFFSIIHINKTKFFNLENNNFYLYSIYILGLNDGVKCFYCDGIVQCWDPQDDPWLEHIKWYPQCGFLKILQMERDINQPTCSTTKHNSVSPDKSLTHMKPLTNQNSSQVKQKEDYFSSTIKNSVTKATTKDNTNIDSRIQKETDMKILTEHRLLEELKRLQEEKLCKICLDKECEVLFTSCGHFVSCNICALSLQDCPVCRNKIDSFIKVYLS
jgi:hypothetical protein